MKGLHNHSVMQEAGGRFIGKAVIYNKDLYDVGGFPAIVDGDGKVYGEVYSISSKERTRTNWLGEKVKVSSIKILDRLEGYSPDRPEKQNMYLRKKAKVKLANGRELWVSYYYWNKSIEGLKKIENGDYRVYRELKHFRGTMILM